MWGIQLLYFVRNVGERLPLADERLPFRPRGEYRLHRIAEKSQASACKVQRRDYSMLVCAGILMLIANDDRVPLHDCAADHRAALQKKTNLASQFRITCVPEFD